MQREKLFSDNNTLYKKNLSWKTMNLKKNDTAVEDDFDERRIENTLSRRVEQNP